MVNHFYILCLKHAQKLTLIAYEVLLWKESGSWCLECCLSCSRWLYASMPMRCLTDCRWMSRERTLRFTMWTAMSYTNQILRKIWNGHPLTIFPSLSKMHLSVLRISDFIIMPALIRSELPRRWEPICFTVISVREAPP